eukprot:jgi/Psemu1/20475/gm1.20475_g
MEPKTSYSNVAANPPLKANDAATHGQQSKSKDPTTKRNPDRFVGHNQMDLKGILIPEDANAKHYNDLSKERLETLGGSKYIPQEYSVTVTDPVTQAAQTVEIPGLKETLMDMYKEELKKKADKWIQYQHNMEKMYQLTLGQIDDGMKAKLKGLKAWKVIDSSKCVMELLEPVQDLCFQSSRTKVHPVTNQCYLHAASYVRMIKENLDVVKSLGGSLVCKATVSYKLEINPLYNFYDYTTYLNLTGATRMAIDHAVEQRAIAALIIEVLADNYALQQNNYPTTSVEALDMLVTFKDPRKPAPTRGNTQNNGNNNAPSQGSNTGKQQDRRKDKSSNERWNLFTQQGKETTNLSTDQHSRQLLMTTVESGEDFSRSEQIAYMFLNIGMLSEQDNQPDAMLASSTVSSTSICSSNDSSNDSIDVPALAPRTHEYPDSSVNREDTEEDFHFGCHVEHLYIQSRSEGGVNPYWILLDSKSSLNLIVNPELVNNIRQALNGGFMNIHCSSGVSKTNLIANLPGFGVTMDTSIDNAIYVHKDGGTRRFQRSECNLYCCDMREHNGTVLAVDTVEGKANSYSALYCSRAKKARDMQETLGFPTSQELIKMIDNNIIKDCPITRRGIKIMLDIYGKHASILKGKSVRQQAREDITPVPNNILEAYRSVTLCVGIITVNSIQFLSARGFHVTQIHADNQFECIRDTLLDMEQLLLEAYDNYAWLKPVDENCAPVQQYS